MHCFCVCVDCLSLVCVDCLSLVCVCGLFVVGMCVWFVLFVYDPCIVFALLLSF